MIEYIRGQLVSLTPANAIVECASGLAYNINISLPTYEALREQRQVKVLVHELLREDSRALFGFATEGERELFRLLIGVSGVGAGTARIILSSYNVDELGQLIASGDSKRLKAIKGIGAKTAERIIVDLKDKIKPGTGTLSMEQGMSPAATAASDEARQEALAALTMLGFAKAQSQKVLKALFDKNPDLAVETAIKKALSML